MGKSVKAVYDFVAQRAGGPANVIGWGLPPESYEAVSVVDAYTDALGKRWDRYYNSLEDGVEALRESLLDQLERCDSQTIALVGYSQGAQVVGLVIESVAADARFRAHRDRVVGAVLLGDPLFNPSSAAVRGSFDPTRSGIGGPRGEFSSSLLPRVRSYCIFRDIVCSFGWGSSIDPHLRYHEVFARHASEFLADRFGLPEVVTPPEGDGTEGPDPSVGLLDLILLIDTTGSMSDDILAVREASQAILDEIAASDADYRAGLVLYRDHGDEYVTRIGSPFTNDLEALRAAIDSITVGGGGDKPEAMLAALDVALDFPWRDGAKKALVVMADAPPHNPDRATGLTEDDILRKAFEVNPASIFPIIVDPDLELVEALTRLAEGSSGEVFEAEGATEVVGAITEAIEAISRTPVGVLDGPYEGRVGTPMRLSGAASFDPDGSVEQFEWDFDNDGVFDSASPAPVVDYTYTAPFRGVVTLRTVDDDGRVDVVTAPISVTEDGPTVPGSPGDVVATTSEETTTVKIVWSPPTDDGGQPVQGYLLRVSEGPADLIGAAVAGVAASTTSVEVPGLLTETSYRFTVTAVNEHGAGQPSVPSNAVVPGTIAPSPPPPSSPPPSPPPPSPPAPPPPPQPEPFRVRTDRVSGTGATALGDEIPRAVKVAVAVSQSRYPNGADGGDAARHAVLSRDDAYPDSLAASALTKDGPLLLTGSGALTLITAEELDRVLGPGGQVFLLGGVAAIGQSVEDQLRSDGYDVVRLAGPSRIETAVRVADEVRALYGNTGQAALARAYGTPDDSTAGWADAVTGGGWAALTGTPILVTPQDHLALPIDAWLASDDPAGTVLLGGSAALSEEVEQAVPAPRRVAGGARPETAARIAIDLWPAQEPPVSYALINGYAEDGWAHGLTAAGLAADTRAPVLIVGDALPEVTAQTVVDCSAGEARAVLIGDESIVSPDVVAALDDWAASTCVPGG